MTMTAAWQAKADGRTKELTKLQVVYGNTLRATAINVINGVLVAGANWWTVERWAALGWLAALAAILLIRLLVHRRFRRQPPARQADPAWRRLAIVLAGCSGLLWGIAGIIFLPETSPVLTAPAVPVLQQLLTLVLVAGMAAGALPILSTVPAAYGVYAAAVLMPFAAVFVLAGSADGVFLVLASLVYLAVLLISSRLYEQMLDRTLDMRFENEALLEAALARQRDVEGLNAALQTVREELEMRVAERTGELSRTVRNLEHEMSERQTAEEMLRQSQKLEAVGQLTGGISHDFNNLLAVIMGNLELLSFELPGDDERLRRMLDNARRSAEQGAVLVEQLLSFSRQKPLQPVATDVNALLGGLTGLLKRTLSEAISVRVEARAASSTCVLDRAQLESALLHLAINARDAMPDGGTLTLGTAVVPDIPDGAAAAPAPLGYLELSVADTGEGMPPHVVQRAFEPFFTTKEVGRGSGLGLSMVHGFVHQSHGEVRISSAPGQGTVVRLYLPLTAAPEKPASTSGAIDAGRRRAELILVVEDNAEVRAMVTRILDSLGYPYVEAVDGPAALAALRGRTDIALVFTDVVLPGGMNGAQLAREVKRLKPGMRILFTTGYADTALDSLADDPDFALLRKPYRVAELADALARALGAAS